MLWIRFTNYVETTARKMTNVCRSISETPTVCKLLKMNWIRTYTNSDKNWPTKNWPTTWERVCASGTLRFGGVGSSKKIFYVMNYKPPMGGQINLSCIKQQRCRAIPKRQAKLVGTTVWWITLTAYIDEGILPTNCRHVHLFANCDDYTRVPRWAVIGPLRACVSRWDSRVIPVRFV